MAETIRTLQLSVSQQAVSKRDMEMQNEKLEEYQKQVTKLQRLMEETKMVSENKIRQLQTENEALRLHLRLALDSLKNPIPPVEVIKRRNRNSSPALASAKEEIKSEKDRDKENTAPQEPPDLIWEDSISELDVEVQAEMEDLLSDLSFFRHDGLIGLEFSHGIPRTWSLDGKFCERMGFVSDE
ncbi:kinesin family protein [Coccidioides immitis RMSCC 3703]|uniref:Kinesin family protein n=1 Tax=Coccidioides immitis RMSCC 3703 TaxID=454286 RepID=A0A0J8U512_COCIT|nr:kinesin family protein [Coccidioides immitis RMSCC 3703]